MYDVVSMIIEDKKESIRKPKLSDVFVMDKKKSVVKNKQKKTKTNGKDITGDKKKTPKVK